MRRTEGAAALALLDRELIDAESPSPLYFRCIRSCTTPS